MNEKYTFVSYAHKDRKFVIKEIKRREKEGLVFWYDDSIEVGSDWAESIAKNLSDSSSVLYFSSPASAGSENCKRELSYARENNIPVEIVQVPKSGKAVPLALAFLAIALVFGVSFFKNVPSVVGKTLDEGIYVISDAGFTSHVDYEYSEEYGFGYISNQSQEGTCIVKSDIVLVQSLGPNRLLCLMPNTIGSYVSDGIRALIGSGFEKFSILPTDIENETFGEITQQSAPAGYMISSENTIILSVATKEKSFQFEYDGRIVTVDENGLDFTVDEIDSIGLSSEEWQLFYENSNHQITDFLASQYESSWLAAESAQRIKSNPYAAYGWVIVRDMQLDAEDLFDGYCELYVCPGVCLTINGQVEQKEGYTDFYVAKGALLVFNDGINGGANICNDGKTIVHGDYDTGGMQQVAFNRGEFIVDGAFKNDLKFFSFKDAVIEGIDETNIGISKYSFDGYPFYEGVRGSNGMFSCEDGFIRLNKYISSYGDSPVHSFGIAWYPIFKTEQLKRDGKKADSAFGLVIVEDMQMSNDWYLHSFRNGAAEFDVASGVKLVIPEGIDITTLNIHVDKGAYLEINSDIQISGDYGGTFVLFNLGEVVINGNLQIDSPVYGSNIVNCGSITGSGSISGTCLNVFVFKDSVNGIDYLNTKKVYSYDYDPNFEIAGFEGTTQNNIWEFVHRELKKDD